ncbi:DUF1232 domain-containing protein [Promicromonospora sp. NPDC023805]|uniref:DUF1232 domain-containing protein n=1 Tax=Promicromonospora sp. NPDC023805 TaxID=3154696 RepID=UPI0033CBE03F
MGDEKKRGKDPRKFTWQEILTFIAGAGYVASPIDLLSEGVLGPLGLGDDAIAIVIAGVTLFKAVQRFRQHRPKPGAPGDTSSGSPKQGGTTSGAAPSDSATPGSATPGSYATDKTIPGTAEDVTPGRRPKR